MSDFRQREREASDLRKKHQFQDALTIYRDLWQEHQDQFNDWAAWNYAKCAQKCEAHDEADRVARFAYDRWPDFDLIRQVLAWSHYYRFFKEEPPPGQPLSQGYWQAAEEVLTLCEKDPYSKYAPYVRILFAVVKQLESRRATRQVAEKRLKWLGYLDPEQLDSQAESFTDSEGKLRELASDLENWYSHMSKALLDAGRYEECIDLCRKALQRIAALHYDNNIWFQERIAKAKAGMGQPEEALADLKEIVLQKPEWHIHKEIALLSYKLKQYDEALRHSAEAALGHAPLPFKWELFLLMAVTLRQTERNDLARQHAHLAARIRGEENWSIKGRTRELFDEFGVDAEVGPTPKELVHTLRKHWKTWTVEMLPQFEGAIDWVHQEKPFGFIKTNGLADSVYFQTRNFEGGADQCTGGTRVRFCVKESYDAKKQQMSKEAVQIVPLS